MSISEIVILKSGEREIRNISGSGQQLRGEVYDCEDGRNRRVTTRPLNSAEVTAFNFAASNGELVVDMTAGPKPLKDY